MNALTDQDSRLLAPLTRFYNEAGRAMPAIERVEDRDIPQPQRGLLTQPGDMTPALEGFYEGQLHLRVLGRHVNNSLYSRQVALLINGSDTPVGFGAIDIYLAMLERSVRDKIIEARRPLGGILLGEGVEHRSQPQAFLRVQPDAMMNQTFQLDKPCALYGRCNRLVDDSERTICDVVEIMCPGEAGGK